jgi:hypothetical protein
MDLSARAGQSKGRASPPVSATQQLAATQSAAATQRLRRRSPRDRSRRPGGDEARPAVAPPRGGETVGTFRSLLFMIKLPRIELVARLC